MLHIIKRIVLYAMVCTLPLMLSGCFLRLLFGSVVPRDTEFGRVFIAEMGGTWGPMAICDFDESGTLIDCSYTFIDIGSEIEITRTSSAQLISELGILGVFVDPLILQVPSGATNFTGTFDDGSGQQSIVISEVSSFNAEPGTTISAEPGQKFVILEFPSALISSLQSSGQLDGPFDFNFEFEVPSLSPVDVKAMYTGKVEVNGQTFYPPMLPCVTDFADVPAITIPDSPTSVDLMSQILSILNQNPALSCDNVVYDFTLGGTPPTREVAFDIKPGSCPNPLNTRSKGVLPVAILGAADFDVNDIDLSTIQLEGISPLRSATEDVSSPVPTPEDECECANNRADGFDDLTMKFKTQDIVAALGPVGDGDEVILTLTGNLLDGTDIEGRDCVVIISKGRNHKLATLGRGENLPDGYKLNQNHPNPFNPSTEISFHLPEAGDISLRIYDVQGKIVRMLANRKFQAGHHKINWDGRDSQGTLMPSGIYLYELKAGSFSKVMKMSLLK